MRAFGGPSCNGFDAFCPYYIDNTVLPIELEIFEGDNQDEYNYLYWVTASETDNDHFTVETSRDTEFWEYVETIEGSGTVSTPTAYEYKDYNYIDGVNYYRLVQTDYDGAQTISKTIAVSSLMGPKREQPVAYDAIGRIIEHPDSYIGIIIFKYDNGSWYKITRLK